MLLESLIIGAHLHTYHIDRSKGFIDETPGIYASAKFDVMPCDISAGVYSNSEGGVSPWAGCTFKFTKRELLRLTVGYVGGYKKGGTILLLPSVLVPLNQQVGVSIGYVPKANKTASDGIHFTIEYKKNFL